MINPLKLNGIGVFTKGAIKNKAVVFIHGNSLSALTFKKQFELIENIPLVAFDLPGHGNSESVKDFENAYCLPGYIKTLKDIISKLGISNYILAGHSLGGHIAIEAADELDSCKGLFIFGTPPISIPPQMDKMFLLHPLMNLLFSGEISKTDALELAKSFIHAPSNVPHELSEYIIKSDPNTRVNLGASIGKLLFKDEIEIIRNQKMPVAIAHGKEDGFVNLEYIEQQKIQNLWNDTPMIFENSGHCPQLEEPVAFNKLIMDYHHSVFSETI